MSEFSEDEQLYSDLDWYAVDINERIGQFLTGGSRLLPPKIASNKEDLEKLSDYFTNLPFNEGEYIFCQNLEKNFVLNPGKTIDKNFMPFSQKMASRGLFSYDSNDYTYENRPYIRIAIPVNPLILMDLPSDIRGILENLRLPDIDFEENLIISEEIADSI